ncbi:unnamed protein product [Moneuplotes crassus]|uniref:MORN repeat protein n=1 Tax=Euplotes crassus TaxID=5936 RepID=A0AAD1XTX7_EUPCR|nr:unnamed protein product [Moneuplotes crassus]
MEEYGNMPKDDQKNLKELLREQDYFEQYCSKALLFMEEKMTEAAKNLYRELDKPQIKFEVSSELEFRPISMTTSGDIYFGQWNLEDNSHEGIGIGINPRGQVYQGSFRNNRFHGSGLIIYKSGLRYYKGAIKDHKRNGNGLYVASTGYRYDGEWENEKASGYGVETFPSGAKYEGYFVNDNRCGFGKYVYPDKERYEGEWKSHRPNGYGHYIKANGSQHFGNFKDRKTLGFGSEVKPDGRMLQGEWDEVGIKAGIFTDTKGREYQIKSEKDPVIKKFH